MPGKSTKPTVELWLREVNDIAPGGSVSLESLAKLANLSQRDGHFLSCLAAFKKEVLENRGVRISQRNGSLHFLSFEQAKYAGHRDLASQENKADRDASRIAKTLDPRKAETEQDKQEAGLLIRAAHATLTGIRNARKEVPTPADVKGNPRLRVVNGDKEKPDG